MSQPHHIPPRRRLPPRLRVKSGCLTCLDRHKKCDETKPSCQACARLCLKCVWRDSAPVAPQPDQHSSALRPMPLRHVPPALAEAISTSLNSSTSALTLSPSRVIAGHSGFRSTDDQSVFAYFVSIFGPMLCDGRAHPFYRDSSYCLSLALQVPWLMDSILAVAEHHYASSRAGSSASALRHYGQALRGLRESIASMTFPQDSVLCAVTFAGLFEERLYDHRSPSMVHFYSSCTILRALIPSLGTNHGSKCRMAFLRQQADITIYHIATRAIFEPDTQKLFDQHGLEDLDAYLQKVHPGPQDVDPFPSSSFLGPVPRLYMLVHQITLLARKTPLCTTRMRQAQGYLERITDVKALVDATASLHFAGEDVANPFLAEDCTPRLYILAMEILLMKIMRSETTSSDFGIQSRVHEAHELLSRRSFVFAPEAATCKDMSYHLAEPLCWPMLVIGVAVLQTEHRATFEKVLDVLWNVSYNGFVRRVSIILKRVWSVKNGISISSQAAISSTACIQVPFSQDFYVGLDVLVQRNGIPSP